MRSFLSIPLISCLLLLTQCGKGKCDCVPPPNTGSYKLTYGDSILYLKNKDYVVTPLMSRAGTYSSFPDKLTIDKSTGAITVTQKDIDGESQTGMWYKIYFHSATGNEVDKFYNLSQNDSIIQPIYNGDPSKVIPAGNYDLTSDNKFAINPVNGQI